MSKTMKSFRLSEDAIYDLEKASNDLNQSQADIVEMALTWFYATGAKSAIEDLRHIDKYSGFKWFYKEAVSDGKIRETVRTNNGLGIAPIIY